VDDRTAAEPGPPERVGSATGGGEPVEDWLARLVEPGPAEPPEAVLRVLVCWAGGTGAHTRQWPG
jgi:hypothetical protein